MGKSISRALKTLRIERIYTGYCTGREAYEILKEELGDKVESLQVGKVLEM